MLTLGEKNMNPLVSGRDRRVLCYGGYNWGMTKPVTKEDSIRNAMQEAEEIDAMGQENEKKAAKAVIELSNVADKEQKHQEDETLTKLTDKRNRPKIFSYKEELAMAAASWLRDEEFPGDYHWMVEITDKGIRIGAFSQDIKWRKVRQFAICGDPKFDLNACYNLAMWASDEVFKQIQNQLKQSDFIIPNIQRIDGQA